MKELDPRYQESRELVRWELAADQREWPEETKDIIMRTAEGMRMLEKETPLSGHYDAALRNPVLTEFVDREVELYAEDALRAVSLQTRLHDELIPALLRKNHPEMSDDEVAERVKDIIDPNKPSPHATGGALDIILRYKNKPLIM